MNLVSFSGSDDVWTPVDASALAEILSALRLRGISTSPLLFFSVGTDDKNSSRRTVFSGQSGITLPDRDYYLGKTSNDAQLKAYRQYISNCFQLSGFAESESDGNSIASAIIAFETMIAEKMLPNDELRDPEKLYNPILIDDIASSSPNFAWKEYSQKLFEGAGINDVPSIIVVETPAWPEEISKIIGKTSKSTLTHYLHWNILKGHIAHLGASFRKIRREFRKAFWGINADKPRWEFAKFNFGLSRSCPWSPLRRKVFSKVGKKCRDGDGEWNQGCIQKRS